LYGADVTTMLSPSIFEVVFTESRPNTTLPVESVVLITVKFTVESVPSRLLVPFHVPRTSAAVSAAGAAGGGAAGATLSAAGLAGPQRLATSVGNSAGTLGWPRAHGDWVRPGLALYGVSPFAGESAEKHGLKPVMTLETTVLTVREVKRGESVGYAAAWRAGRDSSIAILAAGYGDGLPRHLANGTPVQIGGVRYPLVGRVSMDMIAVDVTGAAKIMTGNRAVIWGEGLPVEEIATHADTIPYELLCGVSQRVPIELK
jgi:alanine racemase